jgi:thioredoxin reductase (NADPH)
MNKKVEIYSKTNCSYCDMAMNFFDSRGISYEVYSADDQNVFKEMLERNPSARTVPQIFIDDQLIGGYTDLIEKYKD